MKREDDGIWVVAKDDRDKGHGTAKSILKKKNVESLTILNFKTYFKAKNKNKKLTSKLQ